MELEIARGWQQYASLHQQHAQERVEHCTAAQAVPVSICCTAMSEVALQAV